MLIAATNSSYAQIGYGPEGGIGMSNMRFAPPVYPILYTQSKRQPILGWKIGGTVDIPMHHNIYLQSGLYLEHKGGVRDFSYYTNDSFNESVHQELHLNYLEAPLNVVFKSGFQGKGRFFGGLGATFSYIGWVLTR